MRYVSEIIQTKLMYFFLRGLKEEGYNYIMEVDEDNYDEDDYIICEKDPRDLSGYDTEEGWRPYIVEDMMEEGRFGKVSKFNLYSLLNTELLPADVRYNDYDRYNKVTEIDDLLAIVKENIRGE